MRIRELMMLRLKVTLVRIGRCYVRNSGGMRNGEGYLRIMLWVEEGNREVAWAL